MKYIIGIDEVGRGPLAGPICFCGVLVREEDYKLLKKNKNLPKLGLDSKKIKKEKREHFASILKGFKKMKKLDYCIVTFSNKVIDKIGLSLVSKKAIEKCLKKLKVYLNDQILLDGGLKAPQNFLNQKTIIKGDEREKLIAWASILAKVHRDDLMQKMSKKYPNYRLDKNVGYGTKEHRLALKKYGITGIHRKTFVKLD